MSNNNQLLNVSASTDEFSDSDSSTPMEEQPPRELSKEEEQSEMFKGQSEDDIEILNESTKSLLMQFMGQLKIGMDLTKIPIPCDFLEPRSLLEKLTDFNTHVHLLTRFV